MFEAEVHLVDDAVCADCAGEERNFGGGWEDEEVGVEVV